MSGLLSREEFAQQPNIHLDALGFLEWEHSRLHKLVGEPASPFYYDSSRTNGSETGKGASSTPFCLAVLYGAPDNCTLGTGDNLYIKWAKKKCLKDYIRPLKCILDSFNRNGNLPRRGWSLCQPPCVDEAVRTRVKVRVQYLAAVLTSWYTRVNALLEYRLKGGTGAGVMTPMKLVAKSALPSATHAWAVDKLAGYVDPVRDIDAAVSQAAVLLRAYLDSNSASTPSEAPDSDDEEGSGDSQDPGNWDFGGAAGGGEGSGTPREASSEDEQEEPTAHQEWSSEEEAAQVEDVQAEDRSAKEAQARADPDIPTYPPSSAQDITAIAGVDLPKLYFTDIRMVTAVPSCLVEAWSRANAKVYRWLQQTVPVTIQHDCALRWELLLHKLLLRSSPKSRGRGRAKRDTLTSRFTAFEQGDYQFLVQGLEKAVQVASLKPKRTRPQSESQLLSRVEKLLQKGRFSKAYRLLDSKGQADMSMKGVIDQLDAKHGDRIHPLQGSLPEDLPPKVSLKAADLARVYHELKPLAGTGPAGYRNEYLTCLTAFMYDPQASDAVKLHADFATKYVNADLPAWYYWMICSTTMIALIKKLAEVQGGVPDVRPVGMGSCKRRAWTSLLMQDNADVFRETFWPVQVACGVKAGIAKLIFGATQHMQGHPDHVLLKLDFTNAFNTVWRSAILKACRENEKWRHLYRFFWATLSPMALTMGIRVRSREGVQQGDPSGPAGFCMALHPCAAWAHQELRKVGGMALFDMDDGYLMGPLTDVMRVTAQFQIKLQQEVGAVLNPGKCELWGRDNSHIRSYLRSHPGCVFRLAHVQLESGRRAYGVMLSGVPFGDPDYVRNRMTAKASEIVSQIVKTTTRLRLGAKQNLYALTIQCLNTKVQFWMQCMHPDVIQTQLKRIDVEVLEAARVATGQAFLHEEELGTMRLRWPRRLLGGTLRRASDVAPAAYIGGICLCVPSFTTSVDVKGVTHPGLLDHMGELFGVGSFDAGKEESRFASFISAGTKLGTDLQTLFDKLQLEVHGPDLDRENLPDDSVFKLGPEGMGVVAGTVLKRPQHELTETREDARVHKVLAQMKRKWAQNPRHKVQRDDAAYLSCDYMSAQFVGLPSMHRTRMDDATFQECWSIYLGGLSPACRPWVGRAFRSFRKVDKNVYRIDKFGDRVTTVPLHGDAWRSRHDAFKWALHEQSKWCQYLIGMEPANLFMPYIAQSDEFMRIPARKRQGMVPDLLDIKRRTLMDVKVIHYGTMYRQIRFKSGKRCVTVRFPLPRRPCAHRHASEIA